MGSTTFYEEGNGATPEVAFQALVDEALYDHGHSGYTGTIAEKEGLGFTLIPHDFATDEEVYAYADLLINKGDERVDDKGGPAGALAFPGKDRWLFFGWASE